MRGGGRVDTISFGIVLTQELCHANFDIKKHNIRTYVLHLFVSGAIFLNTEGTVIHPELLYSLFKVNCF